MKTLKLLLALAIVPLVGCVQPEPKPGTPFCEADCEPLNNTTPNNTTPGELPDLKGAFVSGHLGTYWDCPDLAYQGPNETQGDAIAEGACAEGSECTSFASCEGAQVTISISNTSDTTAAGILVDRIELFGTDGVSRAILPVVAMLDTATNTEFDGALAAGEQIVVRVEFQGPYNSWELLQPVVDGDGDAAGDRASGGGGIIEATFSSDTHDDLLVTSGELYDVPSVDT